MEDTSLWEGPRAASRSTVVAWGEQEGVRFLLSIIYRGLASLQHSLPQPLPCSEFRARHATQPKESHTLRPPFLALLGPGDSLWSTDENGRGRGLGVTRRSEPVNGGDSTNDCHQRTCVPCVCCVRPVRPASSMFQWRPAAHRTGGEMAASDRPPKSVGDSKANGVDGVGPGDTSGSKRNRARV